MSKSKTIAELVDSNQKRVYVYLADEETQARFIADAEAEGYTFGDGVKLSERECEEFYAINRNKTVNFINTIGRIAFQCNANNIVRVDYKKYISGNENYCYEKPTTIKIESTPNR